MATSRIYICDLCKTEVRDELCPSGWWTVRLDNDDVGVKYFLVCSACFSLPVKVSSMRELLVKIKRRILRR